MDLSHIDATLTQHLWWYAGTVVRLIDADTLDVVLVVTGRIGARERIRLSGLDAPEIYGRNASEAGQAALRYLKQLIPPGTDVIVHTPEYEEGKYGRLLATVHLPDGRSVNQMLLDAGHAVPSSG